MESCLGLGACEVSNFSAVSELQLDEPRSFSLVDVDCYLYLGALKCPLWYRLSRTGCLECLPFCSIGVDEAILVCQCGYAS